MADDEALAEVGAALAAAIVEALPRWAVRVVVARGGPADRAEAAGRAAADALAPALFAQQANPLAVVRTAVRWPTEVLREAGVAPVPRDEFAQTHFPDDAYDLTPMTWADVDESLVELGIRWGATKAHVYLQRHR